MVAETSVVVADPAYYATAVQRVEIFFATLTPESLAQLPDFYATDVYFKDPFNEVRGIPAVQTIFSHMYEALENPSFVITGRVVQGNQCFLIWDFQFQFKRFDTLRTQTVRGTSHLILQSDGRISHHRDYWDAAEELYEKLPWLGGFMRWLKKRANSS